MKYLAHIEGEREQSLKDHLAGTARISGEFADAFSGKEWGYCCGMLHDIGKYSEKFQERLHGKEIKVDHSTAGAQLCWSMKGVYGFLSYCIAGHHAGLPDTGEGVNTGDSATLLGRLKKQIEDYQPYKEEIEIPTVQSLPFDIRDIANRDFTFSFFIRMLYSCLVDADFLDTEWFMTDGECEREKGEPMEILQSRLEDRISKWLANDQPDTVNGRRTEILKNCLAMGRKPRGLFRLTVPTGGGKTVASLAFAINHAVENKMDRIIYVIPYTSIIEQNAAIFGQMLGRENVLEDHCNVDYESADELKPMQLATENWDKPVIVTTNVQFFESLFSNKSSKCRKLHNIANSVIVFDEAQMLPNDYLKPCIAAMEELAKRYRSSIVLCTATQPALQSFFSDTTAGIELCPRIEEQFRFFRRVSLKHIGRIAEETLREMILAEEQALCIVNTKKRAQSLYQEMQGEGVYHLSTYMYPEHRRRILETIRGRLKAKLKCIVVSTSLVEAGVDLDFGAVYRQLAGADSIIQAAGRCNREGKKKPEESITYIFQLEEKEYMPGQRQQMSVTDILLEEQEDLSSLETIRRYFEMLYHYKGESLDKKDIMGKFKKNRFSFAEVSRIFKLIENNTTAVFINREKRSEEILNEIRIKGLTKKNMREAGRYCVNLYENDFQKLLAAGMIDGVCEGFYALKEKEQYSEAVGLKMDVEYGRAVMW